jgi:hypothetical protein
MSVYSGCLITCTGSQALGAKEANKNGLESYVISVSGGTDSTGEVGNSDSRWNHVLHSMQLLYVGRRADAIGHVLLPLR